MKNQISFLNRIFLKKDIIKKEEYQINNNGIILFIQSYPEKNKDRLDELLVCLRTNLLNPCIKYIYDVIEPNTNIPDDILNHPKYKQLEIDVSKTKHTTKIPILSGYMKDLCKKNNININDKEKFKDKLKYRMTYKYAIDLINEIIPNDEIVLISNNDIIIENSYAWKNVKKDFFDTNSYDKCLILSRYEVDKNCNTFICYNNFKGWSNDLWCYKTPIKMNTNLVDFCIGNCPSCDNAMINFSDKSGYKVFNWVSKYRIFQYDRCRENKSSQNSQENTMTITYNTDLCFPIKYNFVNYGFCCPFLPYHFIINNLDKYKTSLNKSVNNCISKNSHNHYDFLGDKNYIK